MTRKLKWKKHEYSSRYYQSESLPEFTVHEYDYGDDGSMFHLVFRHEQHFDTLRKAKEWVQDFREWKAERRKKN
jgi:hypothetical protein